MRKDSGKHQWKDAEKKDTTKSNKCTKKTATEKGKTQRDDGGTQRG